MPLGRAMALNAPPLDPPVLLYLHIYNHSHPSERMQET